MKTKRNKRTYNDHKNCGSLMRARLEAGLTRNDVVDMTGEEYDRIVRVEHRVRKNEANGRPMKENFTMLNMVAMGRIQEAIEEKTGRARIEQIRKEAARVEKEGARLPEPHAYGRDDGSLLTRYLQLTPEGTVITVTIPGRKGSVVFTVK